MNFIININDDSDRKNKNKDKKVKSAKAWKDMKDDLKKLLKKELKLSNAELDLINITRREMRTDTGMVFVKGYCNDPSVVAKVDKKTI